MPAFHTASLTRQGVASLWALCGLAAPVWAGDAIVPSGGDQPSSVAHNPSHAQQVAATLLPFDIAAQPLARALQRYAVMVDLPVVFSSDLTRGRISSAVQGRFTAEEGLQQLLEGTGLTAERQISRVGTVLLLKELAPVPTAPAALGRLFEQTGYPGLVQQRIWQALCGNAATVPGRYRLVFRFRVDLAGRLADLQLLVPTGNASRDAALLEVLQRVQVMPPPPAVALHRLTMSLLPDVAGAVQCAQGVN